MDSALLDLDLDMFLRNSAGTSVKYDNDSGSGDDPKITYTAAYTGNYLIDVADKDDNKTGDYNVGIGINSASGITTGSFNTALGGGTLYDITTGSGNTAIGSGAQASSATSENETMLGYRTTGQGTNTVTLGNSSVSKVYAAQDGEAVVYAGGITFSDGTSMTTASSGGASKLNDLSDVSTYSNGVWINGGSNPETNSQGSNTNVAVGINALDSASNVDDTVAIGFNALTSSSSGLRSVAVGHSALKNSNADSVIKFKEVLKKIINGK